MDPGQTSIRFQDTQWSLVGRAVKSRVDLDRLLVTYWSPVYAYLRRSGRSPDDAADLTQGFLTEVVLERRLLERADPGRGRFRSLILKALERFVVDEYRREHGRDGQRPRTITAEPAVLESGDAAASVDAFEQQWRRSVLERALQRVRRSCVRKGMLTQWSVFEARVVRPSLHGCEATSLTDLQAALDIASAQEISSMIQTVKRKVERALRDILAEAGDDPGEVDHDWASLLALLDH